MDARAEALSALARFQVTQTTVAEALDRIAQITREAIPAADIVGMSMLGEDGRPTTAIYTDPESPAIDEAQYREDRGPCLDAWRDNDVFRFDDIEECEAQYPGFARACRDHGVRSTLSLPMAAGDVAVGAMNLYSRVAEGFGDDDESMGLDLAAVGGTVLANVSAYWTAFELGHHLNEAMASRAVIEQAKGVLMATTPGLDADGAFDLLRRASQRENVKLRDIARQIVEGRGEASGPEGASG